MFEDSVSVVVVVEVVVVLGECCLMNLKIANYQLKKAATLKQVQKRLSARQEEEAEVEATGRRRMERVN